MLVVIPISLINNIKKNSVTDIVQFPELLRNRLHKSQSLKSAHIAHALAFGVNASHKRIAKSAKIMIYETACKLYIFRKLLFRRLIFQEVFTKSKQN